MIFFIYSRQSIVFLDLGLVSWNIMLFVQGYTIVVVWGISVCSNTYKVAPGLGALTTLENTIDSL